ncbi:MAG: SDR family NAD(P)-dependent oxidoreductase [Leptolyngbya sp. BL-A-14]
MTGKLADKVAVITGASSGIGEATALALAAEGAKVVIAARRSDQLEALSQRIQSSSGQALPIVTSDQLEALSQRIQSSSGQALPIVTDVSDEVQIEHLIWQTHAVWGRVDILVNNAGVMLLGAINGADTEDWRRTFDINVLGLMYATHAALPIMIEQGGGHIVNLSSVAGRFVRSGGGVYCASKWAVNAFSEALRQEVSSNNIRVTLIEPGLVATELHQHIINSDAKEAAAQQYKSVKNLDPQDIASAITYAVTQLPHVNVNEILVRPTEQVAM